MSNRESLKIINRRLKDVYGTENDLPNWRVSWSPDQFEDRLGDYVDRTESGIYLRTVTEVRRVPKYGYLEPSWILEGLLEVPVVNMVDLPEIKLTYECFYSFPYHHGKPLMPVWPILKLMIDSVHEKAGVTGPRYKDPNADSDIAAEVKEARLKELEEELFGNESNIGDALAYGEGVGYTGPPVIASTEKEN